MPDFESEWKKACEAFDAGDWEAAFRLLKPLAEQGYADAQHSLGWLYHNRQGVAQDYKEAVKWYRLAADREMPVHSTILV